MSRLIIVCPDCSFSPNFNVNDRYRAEQLLDSHRHDFHASAYMIGGDQ